MSCKIEKTENNFYDDIKSLVDNARKGISHSINHIMVQTNWLIGERIVEQEQNGAKRAKYGAYIIKSLSEKLTAEFGNGFSVRTLREYRQFYLVFSDISIRRLSSAELKKECSNDKNPIRRLTSAELQSFELQWDKLNWTHLKSIMRIKNKDARDYYINETANNSWTVETLNRNISTQYYERLLKSPNKQPVIDEMIEKTKNSQANKMEFIKSPCVLEFINLPANMGYTEDELEKAIIDNIQKFLLELGKGYAFVERQKLIRTEHKDYFIDLVFYNYILKCFVLIDLKTERISHQDVGQMDMYVRMYDEIEKDKSDNPTIGIVLCSETDEDIAKYSILKGNEQLFASKYKLYLPTKEELQAEIEREKLNFKLQFGDKGRDGNK